MGRQTEPCLCGDPECPRCFPCQAMRRKRERAELMADYLRDKRIDDELTGDLPNQDNEKDPDNEL